MLASIPEFREVDFSHLQLADTNPGAAESAPKRQSSFLWLALFISLLVHLSVLFFNLSLHQSPLQKAKQALHIRLQPAPVIEPEVVPDIVEQPAAEPRLVQDAAQKSVIAPAAKEIAVSRERLPEPRPVSRVVLEPLSAQELAEIVNSHTVQSNDQNSAAIAKNVFHPGLRARLSAEANRPTLKRVEDSDLQTLTDPAGATVVKIPGGGCMSSPADTKIGTPKNWYFTACGGHSESEQMMQRVNEEIKGKLRFED